MLAMLFDEEKMFRDAMAEFKAEGRVEGEAIGEAKGRAAGKVEGRINGAIEIMLDDGKSNEEIIKRLISKFDLTETEARERLSAYPVMA